MHKNHEERERERERENKGKSVKCTKDAAPFVDDALEVMYTGFRWLRMIKLLRALRLL